MTTRFGYACINTTLQQNEGVQSNRGMIKRTWLAKGISYASELSLINVKAIRRIVEWNAEHNIEVFRISSCLFPWMSEYDIFDLPDIDEIADILKEAGNIAKENNQRLSFHPGQFCVLASPNESIVTKTVKELNDTSIVMDLLGMPLNHNAKINIHVGGAYGDRASALERFCKNVDKLSYGARSRLTVENDDKPNMYSTKMLYDGVYTRTGIPIVFDSHHFTLGPQDQTYSEAIHMAASTWGNIRPTCHHSNSKKNYEDASVPACSHSAWYYEPFDSDNLSVDVVLECKKKELALFKYLQDFVPGARIKNAA